MSNFILLIARFNKSNLYAIKCLTGTAYIVGYCNQFLIFRKIDKRGEILYERDRHFDKEWHNSNNEQRN